MKVFQPIEFGFDPEKSDIKCLHHKIAKIIWCCIKVQHIVDQYFNDQVYEFALKIEKKKPDTYKDFIKLIYGTGLSKYGSDCDERWPYLAIKNIDDEFWQDVFKYISGEKELEIINKF